MQIEEWQLKKLKENGFTNVAIRKISKIDGELLFLPISNRGFAVIVKLADGDIGDVDKFGNFTWI